jgi:hypothetical protein
LNYNFSNSGKAPVLIEDVGITEVYYRYDKPGVATPDMDICKSGRLISPSVFAILPPNVRSMPKRSQDGLVISKIYTPTQIYIDGTKSTFPSISIEAGVQRAISVLYETDVIDWATYNVVVLCPFIRLFDSSGRPSTEICDGWQLDALINEAMHQRGSTGSRFTRGGRAQLLPAPSSNCYIEPFHA